MFYEKPYAVTQQGLQQQRQPKKSWGLAYSATLRSVVFWQATAAGHGPLERKHSQSFKKHPLIWFTKKQTHQSPALRWTQKQMIEESFMDLGKFLFKPAKFLGKKVIMFKLNQTRDFLLCFSALCSPKTGHAVFFLWFLDMPPLFRPCPNFL